MGNNVPAYTKAIVKYEKINFFDPHSRDHDDISVSDGFATLTVHDTLDHLIGFIGRLADSLFVNSYDVPFEIRKVHFLPNVDEICSDVDSEWSGFSDDAVCRLYLAYEQLTELKATEIRNCGLKCRFHCHENIEMEKSKNSFIIFGLSGTLIGREISFLGFLKLNKHIKRRERLKDVNIL